MNNHDEKEATANTEDQKLEWGAHNPKLRDDNFIDRKPLREKTEPGGQLDKK